MFKRTLAISLITAIFIIFSVPFFQGAQCGLPGNSFLAKDMVPYGVENPLNLSKRPLFKSDYVYYKDAQYENAQQFEMDTMEGLSGIFQWIRDKAFDLFINQGIQEKGSLSGYLFGALLKSILLLLLALLIWWTGYLGFRYLSKHDFLKRQCAGFETRICSYFNIIKKLFHSLIIIMFVLLLLQVWGIKVFGFLSGYSSQIYALIRIPLILLLAIVLIQISRFVISKLEGILANRMKLRPGLSEIEINKQITTVGELIYKAVLITIWIVAVMMILKELGFDIKPILAGAGIVGLAVGFGAQNLVRDVISGLFMIIENQIRVGDVAILNGTGGLVEAINLRTTVLRGLDGSLHIFPNGTVNTISNMTHSFSFYVFDIGVAYKEDVDRVISILKELSEEIMADPVCGPEILEPLEILGLDKFDDSAVIIKARIKTKPIKQWMVGREMNKRIKKRFDQEDVEIPFPHMSVYFGEVSKPFDIRLEQNKDNEVLVKKWIRDVLAGEAQGKNQTKDNGMDS
ncbi:MAG: mechanosensitive ion channel family protein [bacterium]